LIAAKLVKEIITRLRPGIGNILDLHGREFLWVVVFDPSDGKTVLFDGVAAGDPAKCPPEYGDIARRKALLSARTGRDTGAVVAQNAHLLSKGDVIYKGGVNYNGLVVGASGAQGPVDEAIALMIAAQLSAWCQVCVAQLQDEAKKGGPYLVPVSEPPL